MCPVGLFLLVAALQSVLAFPFMTKFVDPTLLTRDVPTKAKRQNPCPSNPVHPGAAPYTAPYIYAGALNGLPAITSGSYKVPANGDTAHQFEAPGPLDIRGPCPGLNTMANHHFISHDGITNLNELMDGQQNAFGMCYDLALFLASVGIGLSGDPVTLEMSIGCDATSRTSLSGLGALGDEGGLDAHLKFEQDASLSRNDYFLSNGDNYSFNKTLWTEMVATCSTGFTQDNVALFRQQRYQQSRADNGNFAYPPLAIDEYGAASTIYRVMAGNTGAEQTTPPTADIPTIASFFGAQKDANGNWQFNNKETFPPNWYRIQQCYSLPEAVVEMATMVAKYPILFGGNAGQGNFIPLNLNDKNGVVVISSGVFQNPSAANYLCLLYQLATFVVPNALSLPLTAILTITNFITGKLNTISAFQNMGCAFNIAQ